MKESKKQTYIASLALVVSIISLAVAIIMAINEYKENIEVIPGNIQIISADMDKKVLNCEIEVIVANESHSSVPIIRARVYKTGPGLKKAEEMNISLPDEWPITLIAGGAEKTKIQCEYKLSDDEVSALLSDNGIDEAFEKQWLSVRIYTTKSSPYYANAKFKELNIPTA